MNVGSEGRAQVVNEGSRTFGKRAQALTFASRRSQAQHALGNAPTDAGTMFLNQAFETAQDGGKKILECSPLEEATIRNHTCVCES